MATSTTSEKVKRVKTLRKSKPIKKEYTPGGIPTAGVSEWRTAMFPIGDNSSLVTPFGEVRFESKNRLTARHRDVLDAVMAEKDSAVYHIPTKQMIVVFDAAKVMAALKFATGTNFRVLKKTLTYIQSVVLSVRKPGDDWPTSFSLIASSGDAKSMTNHGHGQFETKMKKLILTEAAVNMLLYDTHLYVNPSKIRHILSLKHQISRSIMRWCYTHTEEQNHNLLNVFSYVGVGNCSDSMIRRYIRQVAEDAEAMKAGGVEVYVAAKRVHYPGQTDGCGIFISDPKKRPVNKTEPESQGDE